MGQKRQSESRPTAALSIPTCPAAFEPVHARVLLLTGRPGVGKTSIIIQALASLRPRAGGFYTREIREEGQRVGFKLATLDGPEDVLAHVAIRGGPAVGKYRVNTGTLDSLGVTALNEAIASRDLVVIDEIGKMELFSPRFVEAVDRAISSGKRVLGTIMLPPHPRADRVKNDPRVCVVEVTRTNRDVVLSVVLRWLQGGQS